MSSGLHARLADHVLSVSDNCLVVLASGLGERQLMEALVARFLAKSKLARLALVVLAESGAEFTARVITGETSSEDREKWYAEGGLVGVTARVLLSDLLTGRLAPELVDLLVLGRAHYLSDDGNEAFAVRLIREKNSGGTVVLLTDKPGVMCGNTIGKLVKIFCLSDLVLFPRFHELVKTGLGDSPSTHLLRCGLSERQQRMGGLLVELATDCLVEMKKSRQIEKIVSPVELLRGSLTSVDPIALSWRTKQVVHDAAVLRQLAVALERLSPVGFLAVLLAQEKTGSLWWFSDKAQTLLAEAKAGVREAPSKWGVMEQFLWDAKSSKIDQKILIVCPDEAVAFEYSRFVLDGAASALDEIGTLRKVAGGESASGGCGMSSAQGSARLCFETCPFLNKPDKLLELLLGFVPDTVVLTEPSLSAVRALEIAQPRSVLVLEFEEALAERKLFELVQVENTAFDELIKGKRLVTFYNKEEWLRREIAPVVSSRQGGRKRVKELVTPTVLVDVRELRSPLPFALHRAGLVLVPSTLSVGDYVVSRDICVERKSVTGNDLQQSLVSGRLYRQLVNMALGYAWPVLLLEFSRTFQLQAAEVALSGEINPGSVLAQVVALMVYFPTLRLVWSPSFAFTANIFSKLKSGREQPKLQPTRDTNVVTSRAVEFLKTLPGITAANLAQVMRKVRSIRELVQMDEPQLVALLGKREAYLFSKFLVFKVDDNA